MKFQVCDVTRPLASVHKICEMGHSVVFNPSWDHRGSFILNHDTGEKTWMAAKDGVFVLETKIFPAFRKLHIFHFQIMFFFLMSSFILCQTIIHGSHNSKHYFSRNSVNPRNSGGTPGTTDSLNVMHSQNV